MDAGRFERLHKPAGESEFAGIFDELSARWRNLHGSLPAVLCGMVGSGFGWAQAPNGDGEVIGAAVRLHLRALRSVLPPDTQVYPVAGIGANGFGSGSELFSPEYRLAEIERRARWWQRLHLHAANSTGRLIMMTKPRHPGDRHDTCQH